MYVSCQLVACTAADCGEQVSYTDTFVKYALLKGLVDNEVREELMSVPGVKFGPVSGFY